MDGPFTRDRLLCALLAEHDAKSSTTTSLIEYGAWSEYYADSTATLEFAIGESTQRMRVPYEIIIDFVRNPLARIGITKTIQDYVMPTWLAEQTKANLEAYRKEKTRTFNGRITRIKSIRKRSDNYWVAKVERARFFDQARTNLTLDYPIRRDNRHTTLRQLDLGPAGTLRDLSESILVNSLGVSALVGYRKSHQWYFFCKTRKADDAIHENMLGSTSGVAELIPGQRICDLVAFGEAEMLREFYNESGLRCGHVLRIVPLAFARELIRGGKPQFFFFIEIEEVAPNAFKESFRKSAEGMSEFYDGWYSSAVAHGKEMSPELALNLALTLQLLQSERRQPFSPIRLS
jgi:hypothetical protein